MNILLVNQVLGGAVRPIVPLGLCAIATFVQQRSAHRVCVHDPNVEPDWRAGLREVVTRFEPDLVGISFRNSDSTLFLDRRNFFPALRVLVEEVRRLAPGVLLVVGGAGASVFPGEILSRLPEVDACVCGPGEEAVVVAADTGGRWELVPGGVYRDPAGGVLRSKAVRSVPFGSLPFPRREFVAMERYLGNRDAVGVLTKQGCAHSCLYCVYPAASGRRVGVRGADDVVDEMEYLVRDFGVEHLYVADNHFNEPVESMVDLCEAMLRRGVRVAWTAFFTCSRGCLDRELLDLVRRAGCVRVQACPEAYPQGYLDVFGRYSEEEVRAFVELFRGQRDVEALVDFFVEAPGQRWRDFLRLLAYLVGQVGRGWMAGTPVMFKLHALRIYPGTGLFDAAVRSGFLAEGTELLPESDLLDEGLFFLTPARKLVYRLLVEASRVLGYRTPDFQNGGFQGARELVERR